MQNISVFKRNLWSLTHNDASHPMRHLTVACALLRHPHFSSFSASAPTLVAGVPTTHVPGIGAAPHPLCLCMQLNPPAAPALAWPLLSLPPASSPQKPSWLSSPRLHTELGTDSGLSFSTPVSPHSDSHLGQQLHLPVGQVLHCEMAGQGFSCCE